jgi:hypothetical protein
MVLSGLVLGGLVGVAADFVHSMVRRYKSAT